MSSTSLFDPKTLSDSNCRELVTSVYNLSRNFGPILTSTDNFGKTFVRLNGFKHYPILLNEALFKFVVVTTSIFTVLLIVILSIIALCCLTHICDQICRKPYKRSPNICRGQPTSSILFNRTCDSSVHETSSLHTIQAEVDGRFYDQTLNRSILSFDKQFVINSFRCGPDFKGVGHFIQIVPKRHCTYINCAKDTCINNHILWVFIPCETANFCQRQIKFLIPETLGLLRYKDIVVKHDRPKIDISAPLKPDSKEPDPQEPEKPVSI